MQLTYTEDETSRRITAMTLFSGDAVEEIFLTELFRVLCRPTEQDEISVTRSNGEDRLTWKPLRRGDE